ncbi:MAG: foldase protein PrsA, partial [Culicoidibacterales bacterium]
MKEYLNSGAEKFDSLKEKSTNSKQSGAKEVTSEKGITVLEAADYPNVPKGQMVKEFEEAGLKTSPLNAWSEPVKTSFGYHIQYVYERSGVSENQNLTVAKQKFADKIMQTNKSTSKIIDQAMIKLREKNNFSITDERLQKEYETYKKELATSFDAEKKAVLSGDKTQAQGQQIPTATE